MSSYDAIGLMKSINENLAPFRKSQSEVMAGFGQMSKHKEMIALAIGITQHCGGCIAFHVKALRRLGGTRAELDEVLALCVYMAGGPGLMEAAEAIAAWEAMEPAASS
jgi:AhpD family alkylhydroperoxidase